MNQEKIYFENKDGLKLCGIISNPTNDTTQAVVILCHGHATGKDSSTNKALEKVLNDAGVSTFRFDFSGHGESEGKFEDVNISDAVNDIFSAIEYLKLSGYSKIGLEGSSFGGIASIMAASKISDLFALALKCPAIDYYQEELNVRGDEGMKNWKEKGIAQYEEESELNLKYSFVEDFDNNNAFEAGVKIKVPTLIVLGDQDEYIPIEHAEKLSKLISDCRLEVFPYANHHFSKPEDFEKMIKTISNFIIEKAV